MREDRHAFPCFRNIAVPEKIRRFPIFVGAIACGPCQHRLKTSIFPLGGLVFRTAFTESKVH
jgi:hypothetical protein